MKSAWLEIELLTPAAVTETSATVGGHRSLRYLPGGVLFGAYAKRGYPAGDPPLAFRRFHSGELRFGPALPVGRDHGPMIPMPLCLEAPKDRSVVQQRSAPQPVRNRVRATQQSGELIQYRSERGGFLDGAGRKLDDQPEATMRTAIGDGGRARDGLLYSISAIAAGATFLARVDADHDEDLADVKTKLNGAEIFVGKSRKAEFGRASVKVLDRDPPLGAWNTVAPARGKAVFLCLSDLALRDDVTGQPALAPRAASFGLPATWIFSLERSAVRFRTYSPFNGKRRRPDLERQLIAAGSVIVFEHPSDTARLDPSFRGAVGDYVAEGLGWVLFEPALLAHAELMISSEARTEVHPPAAVAIDDPLVRWLEDRARKADSLDKAWEDAMALVPFFAKTRLPAAQWGELRTLARRCSNDKDALIKTLRAHVVAPTVAVAGRSVRHRESRWGRREGFGDVTAGEFLVEKIDGTTHPARTLELLAIHVVRESKGGRS